MDSAKIFLVDDEQEGLIPILRRELLAFGVFRESGQWTLVATVTQENQKRMHEAYDFILDRVDKIIKTH